LLLYYMHELFVDVLCVGGVIAFEFFSRCVVAVSYVQVSCVVSVAEDVELDLEISPPYGGSYARSVL
jgi:hypothetical protein